MGNWTPEQQKEHRKLWVEALRSGKYEQTTGRLYVDGRMCCLGVACDISKLGVWNPTSLSGAFYDYNTPSDSRTNDLPIEVRDWLGLADDEGRIIGLAISLAGYNDEGATFSQLADIIESEPEGLLSSPEAA